MDFGTQDQDGTIIDQYTTTDPENIEKDIEVDFLLQSNLFT